MLLTVPLLSLAGISCFGQVSVSPFLMGACAERGIAVSFLTETGRFLARVEGMPSGNVLMRREQHRRADDGAASLALARSFVIGKLANARTILRRAARDHPAAEAVERIGAAADRLGLALAAAERAAEMDSLRGCEGEGAATYFGAWADVLRPAQDSLRYTGRSRRPPLDPINAVMSFLYTLLLSDCSAALAAVGLDPGVGYLHADRPGRPSLALDLMEEFRPALADRLLIALVNRNQLDPAAFETGETGAVTMADRLRKAVIAAWQERKREEIEHPFTQVRVPLGTVPHLQARLLARTLRGELEVYPPFAIR